MGLDEITSRDAVVAAMREFDEIGRDAFLTKYGFHKSRAFYISDGGKEHPPKPWRHDL